MPTGREKIVDILNQPITAEKIAAAINIIKESKETHTLTILTNNAGKNLLQCVVQSINFKEYLSTRFALVNFNIEDVKKLKKLIVDQEKTDLHLDVNLSRIIQKIMDNPDSWASLEFTDRQCRQLNKFLDDNKQEELSNKLVMLDLCEQILEFPHAMQFDCQLSSCLKKLLDNDGIGEGIKLSLIKKFLRNRQPITPDDIENDLKFCHDNYKEVAISDNKLLDFVVEKRTGISTQDNFWNTIVRDKIRGHFGRWEGSQYTFDKSKGKRNKLEGFYAKDIFPYMIRSVFELLFKLDRNKEKILEKIKEMELDRERVKSFLINQLCQLYEMLQVHSLLTLLTRHCQRKHPYDYMQHLKTLFEATAENIQTQCYRMQQKETYLIAGGWKAHAIYIGLLVKNPQKLRVVIDNLGQGCNTYHIQGSPIPIRDEVKKETSSVPQVKPYVTNAFKKPDNPEDFNQILTVYLCNVFEANYCNKPYNEAEKLVYPDNIKGSKAPDPSFGFLLPAQVVGNCAIENYRAGYERHGENTDVLKVFNLSKDAIIQHTAKSLPSSDAASALVEADRLNYMREFALSSIHSDKPPVEMMSFSTTDLPLDPIEKSEYLAKLKRAKKIICFSKNKTLNINPESCESELIYVLRTNPFLESLSFSKCKIAAKYTLGNIINSLPLRLRTLEFIDCSFVNPSVERFKPLRLFLQKATLESFVVKCNLSSDILKLLLESLKTQRELKKLQLCSLTFDKGNEQLLKTLLKTLLSLIHIDISACTFSRPEVVIEILGKFATLDKLKILHLNQLNLNSVFAGLFDQLKKLKNLMTLSLAGNKLNHEKFKLLTEIAKVLRSLERLDLSHNELHGDDLTAFLQTLTSNCSVKMLNMAKNKLTSDDAPAFEKFIETCPTLSELVLNHNRLSDHGVYYIAQAFSQPRSFKLLDLSYNNITQKATRDLEILMTHLSRFNLGYNDLNLKDGPDAQEAALPLQRGMEQTTALETFIIEGNPIGDTGASAIAKGLASNTSLQCISVADCGLSKKATQELAQDVKHNYSLHELHTTHPIQTYYRSDDLQRNSATNWDWLIITILGSLWDSPRFIIPVMFPAIIFLTLLLSSNQNDISQEDDVLIGDTLKRNATENNKLGRRANIDASIKPEVQSSRLVDDPEYASKFPLQDRMMSHRMYCLHKELISSDYKVDRQKRTPLHVLASVKCDEKEIHAMKPLIGKLVLQHQKNIIFNGVSDNYLQLEDSNHQQVMSLAIASQQSWLIKAILEVIHVEKMLKNNFVGNVHLPHYLAQCANIETFKIFIGDSKSKLQLQSIEASFHMINNALHAAAAGANEKVIKHLVQRGYDVNSAGKNGYYLPHILVLFALHNIQNSTIQRYGPCLEEVLKLQSDLSNTQDSKERTALNYLLDAKCFMSDKPNINMHITHLAKIMMKYMSMNKLYALYRLHPAMQCKDIKGVVSTKLLSMFKQQILNLTNLTKSQAKDFSGLLERSDKSLSHFLDAPTCKRLQEALKELATELKVLLKSNKPINIETFGKAFNSFKSKSKFDQTESSSVLTLSQRKEEFEAFMRSKQGYLSGEQTSENSDEQTSENNMALTDYATLFSRPFSSNLDRAIDQILLNFILSLSRLEYEKQTQLTDETNLFGLTRVSNFDFEIGDCLFNAIAWLLISDLRDKNVLKEKTQELRQLAVAEIEKNENIKKLIQMLTNPTTPDRIHFKTGTDDFKCPESVDEYIDFMKEKGAWGGGIELEALSIVLQRPIVVIMPNNQGDFILGENISGEPLFLSYENGNHYVPLGVPEGANAPEILTQVHAANAQRAEGHEAKKETQLGSSFGPKM